MKESEIKGLGNIVYDERDISPAQLGVTSRQINYWLDKKVVPFVERKQPIEKSISVKGKLSDVKGGTITKWIRLNLAQAVWVSIVKELLSFGVSIERLKKLAYSVWHKPREEKYADDVFRYNIENNFHFSDLNRDILINYSKDDLIMEHYFRTIINPFTDLIKSAILREGLPHSMIYIPETNEYEFHSGDNELMIKLGSAYLENSMICIPIVPILAKVLAVDFGNEKKDLPYLNNVEKQIRDIVVFKKPKEVVLALDEEGLNYITITEEHKSREELSRYILENKIAKGSKLLIDIRSQDNYKITLIKK